jgi:ribosomal protein L11 methyltransferase
MYSLHLNCSAEEVDAISFSLWEAGTVGIREEDRGRNVELIAGFPDSVARDPLTLEFSRFEPHWEKEDETDWVAATEDSWPAREIGQRIFLAPVWNCHDTSLGRVRVVHNPGLASGTGEHPCTQLALESLERCAAHASVVVDIGTGSGILAITALRLGAKIAVGVDMDLPSLATARQNFALNELPANVVMGSADCIASEVAGVVVANISGTVLLAIADELLRIVKTGGWLILTGFPESELAVVKGLFGAGEVSQINEWRCLTLRI